MRDIKFKFVFRYAEANIILISRAYSLDELVSNEKMITTEEIADEVLMCDCKTEGESLYPECNCDEIFGHFELIDRIEWSGILDKNGVEIYEGDIVREHKMMFDLEKPEGEDVYYEYRTGEIEYLGHSYWVSEEYIGFEGEGLWDWNQLEVIGNRFQHPELLNAK